MKEIFISLAIGILAGVIDIIPMLIKKLDNMFTLSAFTMWVVVGFLNSKVSFTSYGWVDGIIISTIILIPMLFLIIRLDKGALPQICVTTILLGAVVGFLSDFLIN